MLNFILQDASNAADLPLHGIDISAVLVAFAQKWLKGFEEVPLLVEDIVTYNPLSRFDLTYSAKTFQSISETQLVLFLGNAAIFHLTNAHSQS